MPGHEGRKADMSPAAGAAMRAVLAEMGREGARYEAANKLITNHDQVLRDLCRADGPPTSQPELARLPGQEREVNIFLREATRRLRKPGENYGATPNRFFARSLTHRPQTAQHLRFGQGYGFIVSILTRLWAKSAAETTPCTRS